MWILLVGLTACSDYGFGRDIAPADVGSDDTDTTLNGGGDTDGSDTDPSGDGDVGDDTDPTNDDTDPTGGDTDPGVDTGPVPDIPDDACDYAAEIDGYLDAYQTPGDGRVYYCHSGSGNYTLVDSNISSCLTHLDHEWDVFPTSLCDS